MSITTRARSDLPDTIAPDGSEVRILASVAGGSMAEFTLPAGAISKAVAHRTVEEVWCIIAGTGRMWRKSAEGEDVTELAPGVSLAIQRGTAFQFRCDGDAPLVAIGVTMPPWPGMEEAYEVAGVW